MESEQEVKELEEKLKNSEVKTLSLKWRIILLIIIVLIFVGGYLIGEVI